MADPTATAADWQPTEAGVDAVMAAVNTPVDDEGVVFVTEPVRVCPRCAGSVFTLLRHCAVCGWFIGWGP